MPEKHKPKSASKQHRPPPKTEIGLLIKRYRSSRRWKRISTAQRARFPICQHKGCNKLAKSVHHIFHGEGYPELFWTLNNLIPLCDDCHGIVSALERSGNYQQAQDLYSYWPEVINQYYKDNYNINTNEEQ